MGRRLAIEQPADADLVIPVPDSAIPAAIGYAEQSGLPFREGLIKNRYVGRTFIQPGQTSREASVRLKFNPLPEVLAGKRVVVVDDSIVRGTTTGPIVAMLRRAGAREVHVRIHSPQMKYPCYMGVDTGRRAELIAANLSLDGIRRQIGADTLGYLSQEGLLAAVGRRRSGATAPPASTATTRSTCRSTSTSSRSSAADPDGAELSRRRRRHRRGAARGRPDRAGRRRPTATPAVMGGVGGFGSLFRFDPTTHPDPVLVASTDGVGTKLKLAIAPRALRHASAIDLVHHCINDIAVQGADPLFFLDYLAVGRLRAEVAAEIVTGIANACAAAGVALVGGETAELPDLYRGDDFDLAGFIVGVVAAADVIDGSRVREGDVLLGLPSSGLHTNGYSLARRVFGEDDWSRTAPGTGADDRRGAARAASVLPRRDPDPASRAARRGRRCARLRAHHRRRLGRQHPADPARRPGRRGRAGSWPVPLIFSLIQERGDIADDEMVRAFNLGIGLTCVVHPEHEDGGPQRAAGGQPRRHGGERGAGGPRVTFAWPMRLGILVSGRGSNLEAVLDAIARGSCPASRRRW